MIEFYSDLIPALVVSGIYTLIFAVAELWRHFGNPRPESTRKLVHLAGGLTALSFSYIFESHWTVLFLVSMFFTIILVSQKLNLLKSVHGVDRKTSGGIFFPIAVYITFIASIVIGDSNYYFLSILILAVSDSMAALVGSSYGVKKYHVNEDRKSIEGSAIFFLSTYIIISAGLLLLTDFGRIESVLAGVYIASLVTAFESLSWKGTDNIYIPLGTIYLLNKMTDKPYQEIGRQILIMYFVMMLFYTVSMRKKKVSGNALFGISLLGYGAWSLMEFSWFVPVITGYMAVNFLDFFVSETQEDKRHRIRPVFYLLGVSLIWILSGNFFYGKAEYFFTVPYLINFSANMSILWSRNLKLKSKSRILKALKRSNILVRSVILTVFFVPVQYFFDKRIEFLFSMISVFTFTVLSDYFFHLVSKKLKPFTRHNLMRAGFIVTLFFSFCAFIINFMYFGSFW